MDSHIIVKELLKKVPAKHVAQELGVSLSLVYKWAEAPIVGSGTSNPLDRIEVLTRLADDMAPLEWLCSRFEGSFVRQPADEVISAEDFVHRFSGILIELGHVLAELSSSSAATDKVSPAKTREVRKRWEKTKSTIESFLKTAEKGHFSQPPFSKDGSLSGKPPAAKKITPTHYKRSLGMVPGNTRAALPSTTTTSR